MLYLVTPMSFPRLKIYLHIESYKYNIGDFTLGGTSNGNYNMYKLIREWPRSYLGYFSYDHANAIEG